MDRTNLLSIRHHHSLIGSIGHLRIHLLEVPKEPAPRLSRLGRGVSPHEDDEVLFGVICSRYEEDVMVFRLGMRPIDCKEGTEVRPGLPGSGGRNEDLRDMIPHSLHCYPSLRVDKLQRFDV